MQQGPLGWNIRGQNCWAGSTRERESSPRFTKSGDAQRGSEGGKNIREISQGKQEQEQGTGPRKWERRGRPQ